MNRELALEGRDVRLCYMCPAPTDTEAERPSAELWQSMGTPPGSPERAADFVIASLLQRKGVAVMGRKTRLLAWVNSLWPGGADLLGLRRVGRLLRDAFSSSAPPGPD